MVKALFESTKIQGLIYILLMIQCNQWNTFPVYMGKKGERVWKTVR